MFLPAAGFDYACSSHRTIPTPLSAAHDPHSGSGSSNNAAVDAHARTLGSLAQDFGMGGGSGACPPAHMYGAVAPQDSK